MKKALIGLVVAGGLFLAGCGSGPEPEASEHDPAKNGTAKGRLEMDTTDHVSK